MLSKKLLPLFAAGLVASAAAVSVLRAVRRPETNPALRGEDVALRAGCFGCHGPGGQKGIENPGAPSGTVPDWSARTLALYVKSEEDLRDWILRGRPRRLAAAADPPLIPMPAYDGYLSAREIDDLVAYVRAASGWAASVPDDAYEGRLIAARLGCFGCHGPSGSGGVANPGSFKGRVPPWTGGEFKELVRDDAELREWILDGRVGRLWSNRLARRYLENQRLRMPAYRGRISQQELGRLKSYIDWLRSAG